jgi:hypothetical protein
MAGGGAGKSIDKKGQIWYSKLKYFTLLPGKPMVSRPKIDADKQRDGTYEFFQPTSETTEYG